MPSGARTTRPRRPRGMPSRSGTRGRCRRRTDRPRNRGTRRPATARAAARGRARARLAVTRTVAADGPAPRPGAAPAGRGVHTSLALPDAALPGARRRSPPDPRPCGCSGSRAREH